MQKSETDEVLNCPEILEASGMSKVFKILLACKKTQVCTVQLRIESRRKVIIDKSIFSIHSGGVFCVYIIYQLCNSTGVLGNGNTFFTSALYKSLNTPSRRMLCL